MRILFWIFIVLIVQTFGNDSLENALNAVTNRQRHYPDEYDDENLYFLPRNNEYESDAEDSNRNLKLQSSLMDYLREADNNDREEMYPKSSLFRERLKQDIVRPLNTKYNKDDDANEQYYDQYQNSFYRDDYPKAPQNLYNMKKRSYYPSIRWESVGMKKRSRAFQPDGPRESLYLLNYAPRDEIFNRIQEDEDSGDDADYQWPAYNQKRWDNSRQNKRFPVAKRSSITSQNTEHQHKMQYKRSSTENIAKTDPKVAQDLAEIFDPKPKIKTTKDKNASIKPNQTKVVNLKTKSTTVIKAKNVSQEIVSTPKPSSKLLTMNNKKKSIDWSDYFGLDRRKKSEDSLDSDWLMDRYYKAIMKRKQVEKDGNNIDESTSRFDDDKKLMEMDNKLHNIEESLIDDTLKYTGAHEEPLDPKESRYVKDRIISRLAAAYSLEKMRRALGEYRRVFVEDKTPKTSHEYVKRMSIGRKAAIDPNNDQERDDLEDNKIKCHNNDCSQSDIGNFDPHNLGTCPQIEAICNGISSGFGQHRNAVKAICEMHQMCMLCSDNNWFGPLRRCDVLYLSKITEICGDDSNCREGVGNVLNHKLNSEHTSVCSLACPENK